MRSATKSINFTKRSLEAIAIPPEGKRKTIYDTATRGLGLLVHPTGVKNFFWYRKVRGNNRWKTVGPFPDLTIEIARAKADELNAELASWKADDYSGHALKLENRTEPTLGTLNEDYCVRHLRSRAKNPVVAEKAARRTFTNHLGPWQNRKLGSITRSNVRELHAAVAEKAGQYAANRVLQNLRALINWAIKEEVWSGENPATRISQFHEKRRTRFLHPDEMRRLFTVLRDETNQDARDYILLALTTGARKSNVMAMRWDQIAFDTASWEIPDPKNREPYRVALVPEATEILKRRLNGAGPNSPWVFPSPAGSKTGHIVDFKRPWKNILKLARIEGVRQHDLRRTLGAWQASAGASLQMIGKSLGHKSLAASEIYSPMQLDSVRASVNAATSAMFLAAKTNRKRLLAPARAGAR